jgi:hypothetical protein
MTTETGTLTFTGPQRTLIRVDPTASDPTSANFNLGFTSFQGANNPGTTRPDTVFVFGYNVAANGARENLSEPTLSLHFENIYYQFGLLGLEFHVESLDTNGVQHRPLSYWLPRDGGKGSYGIIQADALNLIKYDGTQKIKFDLANNAVTYYAPIASMYNVNNFIVSWQINAAGTKFVAMPYIDNNNYYHVTPPLYLESQLILNPVTTAAAQQNATSNQVALVIDGNHGSPCLAFSQRGVFYMAHSPSTPISAT